MSRAGHIARAAVFILLAEAATANATQTLTAGPPQRLAPWATCSVSFTHRARDTPRVLFQRVPIATRPAQRHSGLNTPTGDGAMLMLFAWSHPVRRPFWMKGVTVPLTVAFIDARGRVVQIERMHPQMTTYHWPQEPIMVAMEARTPLLKRAGVREGSQLDAQGCHALDFARQ